MYYFLLKFLNGKCIIIGNIKIHARYPDSAIVSIPMYPMTSIPEVSLRFSF